MGAKQKGSSTTTSETGYPDWVTDAQKNYVSRVTDYMGQNPSGMPVAGLNDTQRFANQIATGLHTYSDGSNSIRSAGSGSVTGRGYDPSGYYALQGDASQLAPTDYQPFLNEYRGQVVDQTTNRMRGERDASLAQAGARAANSVAFGGSGAALERAQINRGHNQDVGEMTANLMAQGFDKAQQLASGNVDRAQQMGLSNLGFANQAAQHMADATNTAAQFGANAKNQAEQFSAQQRLSSAIAANSADDAAFQRELEKFKAVMQGGAVEQAGSQAQLDAQRTLIDWLGGRIPGVGSTTTTTQPIYGNPLESLLGLVF